MPFSPKLVALILAIIVAAYAMFRIVSDEPETETQTSSESQAEESADDGTTGDDTTDNGPTDNDTTDNDTTDDGAADSAPDEGQEADSTPVDSAPSAVSSDEDDQDEGLVDTEVFSAWLACAETVHTPPDSNPASFSHIRTTFGFDPNLGSEDGQSQDLDGYLIVGSDTADLDQAYLVPRQEGGELFFDGELAISSMGEHRFSPITYVDGDGTEFPIESETYILEVLPSEGPIFGCDQP